MRKAPLQQNFIRRNRSMVSNSVPSLTLPINRIPPPSVNPSLQRTISQRESLQRTSLYDDRRRNLNKISSLTSQNFPSISQQRCSSRNQDSEMSRTIPNLNVIKTNQLPISINNLKKDSTISQQSLSSKELHCEISCKDDSCIQTEKSLNLDEENIHSSKTSLENKLDSHLKELNFNISSILEKQYKLYEEKDNYNKEKYDKLLEKYIQLSETQEAQFFKCSKLISNYQILLFKICELVLKQNEENPISIREEMLEQVFESVKNDPEISQRSWSSRDQDPEISQRSWSSRDQDPEISTETEQEVLVTNPVVSRRYSNPVIKRGSRVHFSEERKEKEDFEE
jgi:hypothetical protein